MSPVDAFIHHNTSDGLDLRYMDGADGPNVTLRRIYSVANAGNQVKIKGNSLIENSGKQWQPVLPGDPHDDPDVAGIHLQPHLPQPHPWLCSVDIPV